jgi:hypothetical protein
MLIGYFGEHVADIVKQRLVRRYAHPFAGTLTVPDLIEGINGCARISQPSGGRLKSTAIVT